MKYITCRVCIHYYFLLLDIFRPATKKLKMMQLLPLTCLSVCLCRNIERILIKYRAGEILLKFEETLQFLVEIGRFTWRPTCLFALISSRTCYMFTGATVSGIKYVEETKSFILCSAHVYVSLAFPWVIKRYFYAVCWHCQSECEHSYASHILPNLLS